MYYLDDICHTERVFIKPANYNMVLYMTTCVLGVIILNIVLYVFL